MRLSVELLKQMCESQEGIVRITGDYTGRSIMVTHDKMLTSNNKNN